MFKNLSRGGGDLGKDIPEQVLSFMLSALPESHSMTRTMVITTQTSRAVSVPHGTAVLNVDIMERAGVNANGATCAVCSGMERFIGDEKCVEETTENMSFETRKTPRARLKNLLTMRNKGGDVAANGSSRCMQLLFHDSGVVDVKTRQTDIGVGHLECKRTVKMEVLVLEGAAETLQQTSGVVTACAI